MHPILQKYQTQIDEITGTMVRLCNSLYAQREQLKKLAESTGVPLTTNLTECSFDSEDANPVHMDTIKNQLDRLENGGFDETSLGNMSIAHIYSLWEDKYRKDYADDLGLSDKNQVKSEIFAELNKYRRAIVHNRSIGDSETKKLQILPAIDEGSPLRIDRIKFEKIVKRIKQELSSVSLQGFHA